MTRIRVIDPSHVSDSSGNIIILTRVTYPSHCCIRAIDPSHVSESPLHPSHRSESSSYPSHRFESPQVCLHWRAALADLPPHVAGGGGVGAVPSKPGKAGMSAGGTAYSSSHALDRYLRCQNPPALPPNHLPA